MFFFLLFFCFQERVPEDLTAGVGVTEATVSVAREIATTPTMATATRTTTEIRDTTNEMFGQLCNKYRTFVKESRKKGGKSVTIRHVRGLPKQFATGVTFSVGCKTRCGPLEIFSHGCKENDQNAATYSFVASNNPRDPPKTSVVIPTLREIAVHASHLLLRRRDGNSHRDKEEETIRVPLNREEFFQLCYFCSNLTVDDVKEPFYFHLLPFTDRKSVV